MGNGDGSNGYGNKGGVQVMATMAMVTATTRVMATATRWQETKRVMATSEVQNKMIIMGHQISSCHVPVVRSFFIL
jgi:hypothetical protein